MTDAVGQPEEYKVDKNLCIDCNACYTNYADIFKQVPWNGETKAEAYAPTTVGKYNPWDVLGVCPTDAISKIGEMPPKPEPKEGEEALPKLEDQGPWEERWNLVKDEPESKWEVMKRYGMAATLSEEAGKYVIKVAFPEKAPHHMMVYKMGLPSSLPDYKYEVELNPSATSVTIKGFLTDPHFKKLTGKINSFPDRFKRTFDLNARVRISRQVYRSKTLMIELLKE